jgi:hypothetical protein
LVFPGSHTFDDADADADDDDDGDDRSQKKVNNIVDKVHINNNSIHTANK